ncbi:MAG: PAS domain-containing protein [Lentisphaerae bacterium]|nr:PAS domain-containing protein [Lentisphaerota bacterium]
MSISRKQKKKGWQLVLALGLIIEIIIIAGAVLSLVKDGEEITNYQIIVIVVMFVLIYIAFLKQKSIDISRSVVEEKIKTQTLVQHLRDGILLLDPANRVLVINPKASEVLGASDLALLEQNLDGKVDADLQSILAPGQFGEKTGVFLDTGRPVHFSVIGLPALHEEEAYKLVYVRPVETGDVAVAAGVEHGPDDAAQAAETLHRIAETIGRFLKASDAPEARVSLAGAALQSLSLRFRLLTGALTGRLKKKDAASSFQPLHWQAHKRIEHLLTGLEPLSSALGVKLDTSFNDPEIQLKGNPDWLDLALVQVLTNALADSPALEGSVKIRTAAMGANVGIAVIDSGPVVAQEAAARLFDVPYAGAADISGIMVRTQSSGLALARAIIEAHGGTLAAEPPMDGGLRIMIMIPNEG